MLFSALWLGCGELGMRKYSPRYGWNADIMRRFLRIPVRILPSAFSPHFFPYKNTEISPRSYPNTPIRIFSAFPPHFFPHFFPCKNAEISPRSCPNTPIRIFSARKMRRSGVRESCIFKLFVNSLWSSCWIAVSSSIFGQLSFCTIKQSVWILVHCI